MFQLTPADPILFPLGAALGLSVFVERVVEFLKNASAVFRITPHARAMPKLDAAVAPADELQKLVELNKERSRQEALGDTLKAEIEAIQKQIADKTEELSRLQQRRLENQDVRTEIAAAQKAIVEGETTLDQRRAALKQLDIQGVWDERYALDTVLVEPATETDQSATMRAFFIQSVACSLGIIAAHYGHVRVFGPLLGGFHLGTISEAGDQLLTGLFIAGGSSPIHVLIRFISDRQVPIPEKPPAASAIPAATRPNDDAGAALVAVRAAALPVAAAPAPGAIPSSTVSATDTVVEAPPAVATGVWRDIAYDGGVDKEILQAVHRRSEDPNLIVFHHTAMDARSKFQDVVRVIKERTDKKGNHWITGYHCVILYDGSIHPFCRWDRFGNHAEGYNDRSLGITMNGNFETDPSVPDSNPRGRYGPSRPSEAQLDSAARVTALWCHLYGIPTDFKKSVIPHKWIATTKKTCPGSNFPYEDYQRLVQFYYDSWASSDAAQASIAAFARKPYLFAGSRKAAWA